MIKWRRPHVVPNFELRPAHSVVAVPALVAVQWVGGSCRCSTGRRRAGGSRSCRCSMFGGVKEVQPRIHATPSPPLAPLTTPHSPSRVICVGGATPCCSRCLPRACLSALTSVLGWEREIRRCGRVTACVGDCEGATCITAVLLTAGDAASCGPVTARSTKAGWKIQASPQRCCQGPDPMYVSSA
jgi:hypothetical protein